jgi:hypothetical protein
MLNAYHITPIIIILYSSGLATFICVYHNSSFVPSVCVFHNSPSSSRIMNFIVFGRIRFMKLLSHHQGSFLSPWCCLTLMAQLPTCVPAGNSAVKVEWTRLADPTYKSRCGARNMSHVHPRSVPAGAQPPQRSRNRCCGCAVLTCYSCQLGAAMLWTIRSLQPWGYLCLHGVEGEAMGVKPTVGLKVAYDVFLTQR